MFSELSGVSTEKRMKIDYVFREYSSLFIGREKEDYSVRKTLYRDEGDGEEGH